MPSSDPLAGMRGLHLPEQPGSFWSDVGLAAAIGLLAALAVAIAVRLLFRPKQSLRASALAALEAAKDLPPPDRRVAQAAVLRRVVRTIDGDEAARREGLAWGETLDRVFGADFFTAGPGRVFATGLYAPTAATTGDDAEMDRRLEALLAGLRR
ncbi:DUF4381 family protein [Hansschlegelia sp.]|uniref:DUF4381 family protein n=1 Tax=Hansschlegelia sp. TaxID=2041892 RepID=UPI002C1D1DB5|nr:DUF4381 family protein [Hansschlegelia sp.]HVI29233.1 DUF4381 family protein [Hansschlegelia sp.]